MYNNLDKKIHSNIKDKLYKYNRTHRKIKFDLSQAYLLNSKKANI